MSTATRLAGTVLLALGVALSIISLRLTSPSGEAARAQAAAVENATAAGEAGAADELRVQLRAIEEKARRAAAIAPLAAAVKMNVDAETLLDLFDSEEWWRSYRSEFSFSRLIIDGNVVASRGATQVGTLDRPIVKLARRQGTAASTVTVDNQPYLLAAARLPAVTDGVAIIVLGRAATTLPARGSVAAARAPRSAPPMRALMFAMAGVLALAGCGLLVFGRRSPRARAATAGAPERVSAPVSGFWAPAAAPPPEWQAEAAAQPLVRATESGRTALPTGPAANAVAMLGRYRLLARLGEGGMAELFVAEASGVEGFSRNFVLKRLRPELAADKDAVAQFVEEARLQASLVHSNIVPVFDFGMAGNQYFMTQEYIVGRDLARLMERHHQQGGRGLPADIAFFIAHEVLQALAYAHDTRDKTGAPMGIVHRDVAAGNVMVSFQGEVKLSDFGIVKSNRRVSKTQVGMVKGNANFMSPEQARGHAVDGRSDLFSLALLLYYCLTGELLYWGDNDLETLYRAATGPTSADLTAIAVLSEPAASILMKALALDPNERFQSAAEFGEALSAYVGHGKHAIARLMQQLFAEDIRRQTA